MSRGDVAMGRDVPLTGVEAVLPDENVTLNCGVIITCVSYISEIMIIRLLFNMLNCSLLESKLLYFEEITLTKNSE